MFDPREELKKYRKVIIPEITYSQKNTTPVSVSPDASKNGPNTAEPNDGTPDIQHIPDSVNDLIANEITRLSKNQFKTLQTIEVLSDDMLEVSDRLKQDNERLNTSLSEKDEINSFLREKLKMLEEKLKKYEDNETSNILKVLNICDIIEYVSHFIMEFGDSSWAQQMKSVISSINEVLDDIGITKLEPLGKTFDDRNHTAVGIVKDSKKNEQEIAEIRKTGYLYKGRLIRKAEVIVNKISDMANETDYEINSGPNSQDEQNDEQNNIKGENKNEQDNRD